MNQRQFANVLFAVVGVFIVATRLPDLFIHVGLLAQSAIAYPVDAEAHRYVSGVGLGASLLAILVGVGLIMARRHLATRLFAAGPESLQAREAHSVALSIVGCYVAIQGISRLGWSGGLDWSAGVQLVLGVTLFFGARGLSGLWALSHSSGRSGPASENAV